MRQIKLSAIVVAVAPTGDESLYGLTLQGDVVQYDWFAHGWIPVSMDLPTEQEAAERRKVALGLTGD